MILISSEFSTVMLAVMILEGLGRSLDPNLDLLQEATPFLWAGTWGLTSNGATSSISGKIDWIQNYNKKGTIQAEIDSILFLNSISFPVLEFDRAAAGLGKVWLASHACIHDSFPI